jgi:hypothetical protein
MQFNVGYLGKLNGQRVAIVDGRFQRFLNVSKLCENTDASKMLFDRGGELRTRSFVVFTVFTSF